MGRKGGKPHSLCQHHARRPCTYTVAKEASPIPSASTTPGHRVPARSQRRRAPFLLPAPRQATVYLHGRKGGEPHSFCQHHARPPCTYTVAKEASPIPSASTTP